MIAVSVIIPTYNRSGFLYSAVTSVLGQSFQDFEIIIADDASQDDTAQVVGSFNDARIKYVRHEVNKGGAAARNTAIRNSIGRYVAFLDDDDEWRPDKLRLQIDMIEAGPTVVGVVYTGYVIVDRSTGQICGQKVPAKGGDLSKELLKSNCLGGSSTVLLRKECLEKVGLFDEDLPSFQDYDLWIRIAQYFHYSYLKEPLVTYSRHRNKISTNLDALERGVEIMLRKYGSSYDVRKNLSYYYLRLGVRQCERGNVRHSRRALRRAICLYPWEAKHYVNLGLSLLGSEWFVKVHDAKQRIVAALK